MIRMLRCKIHRAAVTGACPDYEGSLTVSEDLARKVGLREYEHVLVGNMANGQRFETYTIYGPPGEGKIELNGATARRGAVGDRLTIMSFAFVAEERADQHIPRIIVLDAANRIVRYQGT